VAPADFFGRKQELQQAEAFIRSSTEGMPVFFSVNGPMGTGTSSFLRKIESAATCAKARMSAANCHSLQDFLRLLETMLTLAKTPLQLKADQFGAAAIAQLQDTKPVLLCIDDAQHLSCILPFCSRLQESRAKVCMAFANLPGLMPALDLQPFTRQEAQLLIEQRLAGSDCSAEQEAIASIAALAIPQRIQETCFHLCSADGRITTAAMKAYAQLRASSIMLGRIEQQVYDAMPDGEFTPTQLSKRLNKQLPWLAPKLRSLLAKGVITKKARGLYEKGGALG